MPKGSINVINRKLNYQDFKYEHDRDGRKGADLVLEFTKALRPGELTIHPSRQG